jgi:flavin-dependent thymidylate synthase
MRVVIAGYNIDSELIAEAAARGVSAEALTPETLSAAYARISRNPAPIDELRAHARQELAQARASNEQIVFEMGHSSVAEHAVFNFDVMGLSRLAIEAVEHFRLCSYTEKSQRYIRLQDDYVLPTEVEEIGLADRFHDLVALQSQTYHQIYERLLEELPASHPELADRGGRRTLEGWAKEDARYVTPLAVEGQLGLTINARNLELMIRRLAAHPLHEVRQLGAELGRLGQQVAPSLLRYTDAGEAERTNLAELARLAAQHFDPEGEQTLPGDTGAVQLVGGGRDGDTRVVAGLLHGVTHLPWTTVYERAAAMSPEEQAEVIRAALRPLSAHDSPPRVFELAALTFDLVISASCFAQLKRHRMATLLVQGYQPDLGYTLPEAVARIGMTAEFQRVMASSARLFEEIAARDLQAAPYALTQAHRRRVLLEMNARELYHFARLRQDGHAQWDIRALADRMLYLARQELPLTLVLACGKDRFEERRAKVLGE